MNYLQAARSPRRWVPAIIATLAINAWLIWALFHGNKFPFAAPEHLIWVTIPHAAPAHPHGAKPGLDRTPATLAAPAASAPTH